jgi:hypothetical protein
MAEFTALSEREAAALRRLRIVARHRRAQQLGMAIDAARIRVSQTLRAFFVPGRPSRLRWASKLCEREARALVSLSRRPGALGWLDLVETRLLRQLDPGKRG